MKEDFVPYDIAVKLKEKGFNEKCFAYYDVEDNVGLLYNTQYSDEILPCQYTDLLASYNSGNGEVHLDNSEYCIDAPTISQVLKWLRETKNIEVVASFSYRNKVWGYQVGDMTLLEDSILSYDYSFPTYEEAALAGITYCLDNLI